MSNSNIVILRGVNLTKDAEISTVNNNSTVAKFSVAKNNGYFDKQTNAWVETETYFYNVELWSPSEFVSGRLRKGQKIGIVGELAQSRWNDKEGNSQSRTYVKAKAVDIIEKPVQTQGQGGYQAPQAGYTPPQAQPQQQYQTPAQPAQYQPQNYQQPPQQYQQPAQMLPQGAVIQPEELSRTGGYDGQ